MIVDALATGPRRLSASVSRSLRRSRSGRPIYLIAPAGFPNYGDELIISVWLRALAVLRPGTPVVVDCHTPGQAAVLHRDEHPDVLFTDTVFRLVNEFDGGLPGAAVANVRSAIDDLGHRPRLSAGVHLLRDARVVHVVGGGFVNDRWPQHLGLLAAAGAVAEYDDPRGRARAVATGQGFLPIDDSGPLHEVLRGMDLVSVRDAGSARAARTSADASAPTDIRHVGDDAWLAHARLLAPRLLRTRPDLYCTDPDIARDVVLCLQSDIVDPEVVITATERILRKWDVPGRRISVVEGIPRDDLTVWLGVLERAGESGLASLGLSDARFVPFDELRRVGLPARPGQSWLTTRFHPHLFASAAGASGVALDGRPDYYGIKHGSLTDAGSPWRVLDAAAVAAAEPTAVIERPDDGGFAPDVVAERAEAALGLAREIYG